MKEEILAFLKENFAHFLLENQKEISFNIPHVFVKPEGIVPVLKALKEHSKFQLNFLNMLTSVDRLGKNPTHRFEMNYQLKSPKNGHFLFQIKVPLEETEKISSVTSVFLGANWPEREVFDLMGIEFIGHPFLERILLPDNFVGHPLRKDYPLEGFGQDYLIEDLLYLHSSEDQIVEPLDNPALRPGVMGESTFRNLDSSNAKNLNSPISNSGNSNPGNSNLGNR